MRQSSQKDNINRVDGHRICVNDVVQSIDANKNSVWKNGPSHPTVFSLALLITKDKRTFGMFKNTSQSNMTMSKEKYHQKDEIIFIVPSFK